MDDVANEVGPARGFPTPWIVVEQADGFRIEDANGLTLACTAFSDDPDPEAGALTRAEALRIAKAIAMVPEMRTIIRSLRDGLAEADSEESRG